MGGKICAVGVLLLCAVLCIRCGYAVRLAASTTQTADEYVPQTAGEQQLAVFADQVDRWRGGDEQDWWGYAVTDLNQDGVGELISSECHGTGHYTSTAVYTIAPDSTDLVEVCSGTSVEGEATAPLLMPRQTMSDIPQQYPVYYDPAQGVYHCVYEDRIRVDAGSYICTLQSFSLPHDPDTVPETCLLGRRQESWQSEGDPVVTCWDGADQEISSSAYDQLAAQSYADLQPMTASILWIECRHTDELSYEELYDLLQRSQSSFSLDG